MLDQMLPHWVVDSVMATKKLTKVKVQVRSGECQVSVR